MSKMKVNEIQPWSNGMVGVGGTPTQTSAIFQVIATDKGFLLPVMTTAQRDAIVSPANGLLIFNSTTNKVEKYILGAWTNTEGIKSLNGLTVDAQTFANAAAGVTPNFVSAGSVHTLNIPLASGAAVASGTITNGEYDSFNSRQFPVANVKYVVKNPILSSQYYNSVGDALTSITDASPTNPYVIIVGPGVFEENLLTMKSNVSIVGIDSYASVVKAINPANYLMIGVHDSEIRNLKLTGPTNSGIPLIFHTGTSAGGGSFGVVDCLFGECSQPIKVVNNNTFPTLFRLQDSRILFSSAVDKILEVDGTNSLPAFCFVSNFNYKRAVAPYPLSLIEVYGAGATLVCNGVIVSTAAATLSGVIARDGANLVVNSSIIEGANTGLYVPATGAGPTIRTSNLTLLSATNDILINEPTATANIIGVANRSKITVDDGANVQISMQDSVNGGTFQTGPIQLGRKVSQLTDVTDLVEAEPCMGIVFGGFLQDAGGFNVSVLAGFGYAQASAYPNHRISKIVWPNSTITLSANQDVYIYFNSSGVLTSASSINTAAFDIVLIGRVVTNSTGIELIDQSPVLARHAVNYINEMLRKGIGAVYDSGSIVTENVTPFKLDVTGGDYFFSFTSFAPVGGTAISFTQYYKDGIGGWLRSNTDTILTNSWDNGSGTLATLATGNFTKHTLYINCDDADEKYFLVIGQTEYTALAQAESAPLPAPPPWIKDAVTPIASVVVQKSAANIIEIFDIRPVIGFKSSGVSASADHGNLLGLSDDDHLQYLLVSGIRAMSGNLNMGTFDITNVGLVDGVDVSAHASRHLPTGADPLTTAAPLIAVGGNTANQVGTANSMARSDHQHDVATGNVSGQLPDQANSEGSSNNLARADHGHNIPAGTPTTALGGNSTNQKGVAPSFALSDHQHDIDTGVPGATLPGGANTEGASQNLARADHNHALPVGTPISVADANNAGSANSVSRSDHQHAHGLQTNPAQHAVATTSVNGFLSAADKVRIDNAQQVSEKGAANGYASLDSGGKVPVAQLPDTVIGGVDYKGTWNANTNTPNLVTAIPDKGDYYVVNVAGSTSLGGITDWKIGDWAIYNGTAWEKVDNTDQVTSVFGRQGAVTGQSGDYTGSQVTNVPAGTIVATTTQAAINELDTKKAVVTNTAPVNVTKDAASVGTSPDAARQDHKHDIDTATAATITDSTNSEGSSTSLSRADHGHAHGNRGGGTLHANATASVAGFMSSTDKSKLDAISGTRAIKSGVITAGSFTGNPKKATITFGTAFASTNYSIVVLGGDSRSWTFESQATGSVIINSNANAALTLPVLWIAIDHGESVE